MRLLCSTAAALSLSVVLLLIAACNPEAYNGRANANTAPPVASSGGTTTVLPAAPAQPADNVRRVTVDELKQALAEDKAIVIDVRGESPFKAGHIKGAQMIPFAEIDKHIAELPKDKLIVTYCS